MQMSLVLSVLFAAQTGGRRSLVVVVVVVFVVVVETRKKAIVGTPTAEEVEVETRLRGVAGRGLARDWVEVARLPSGPRA